MAIELAFPELTPREFLDHIVRPNMDAMRADPGCLRHAYNAVLTADALAAHLYFRLAQIRPRVVPKDHDDAYRGALAKQHPAYQMLRDLAGALKHAALLKRDKKGNLVPRIVRAPGGVGLHVGMGRRLEPRCVRARPAAVRGDHEALACRDTSPGKAHAGACASEER